MKTPHLLVYLAIAAPVRALPQNIASGEWSADAGCQAKGGTLVSFLTGRWASDTAAQCCHCVSVGFADVSVSLPFSQTAMSMEKLQVCGQSPWFGWEFSLGSSGHPWNSAGAPERQAGLQLVRRMAPPLAVGLSLSYRHIRSDTGSYGALLPDIWCLYRPFENWHCLLAVSNVVLSRHDGIGWPSGMRLGAVGEWPPGLRLAFELDKTLGYPLMCRCGAESEIWQVSDETLVVGSAGFSCPSFCPSLGMDIRRAEGQLALAASWFPGLPPSLFMTLRWNLHP